MRTLRQEAGESVARTCVTAVILGTLTIRSQGTALTLVENTYGRRFGIGLCAYRELEVRWLLGVRVMSRIATPRSKHRSTEREFKCSISTKAMKNTIRASVVPIRSCRAAGMTIVDGHRELQRHSDRLKEAPTGYGA